MLEATAAHVILFLAPRVSCASLRLLFMLTTSLLLTMLTFKRLQLQHPKADLLILHAPAVAISVMPIFTPMGRQP